MHDGCVEKTDCRETHWHDLILPMHAIVSRWVWAVGVFSAVLWWVHGCRFEPVAVGAPIWVSRRLWVCVYWLVRVG